MISYMLETQRSSARVALARAFSLWSGGDLSLYMGGAIDWVEVLLLLKFAMSIAEAACANGMILLAEVEEEMLTAARLGSKFSRIEVPAS
ncbi:hypothetical protein E6O75_ATG11465 [Venturia nashicola]|uniref:Uncharacterized protein n=1 Tax=Venturia nashicola TaxID=86259 RepID=A0A4Z1P715_9PEZI|nr:hypothetical protein E6O75_ATG11465 [Venturia nashicola]